MSTQWVPTESWRAKFDVVAALARTIGADVDPYGSEIAPFLAEAMQALGKPRNADLLTVAASDAARETLCQPAGERSIPPPVYCNERPASFPAFPGDWPYSDPALRLARISDGCFALLPDMPVVLDANGAVIEELSSQYTRLLHFYDLDVAAQRNAAVYLNGPVFVLRDDLWQLNYCHWMVDWLVRLALLSAEERRTAHVLVSPLTARWQVETLAACGVSPERIVAIDRAQAVRCRELMVPSNLSFIYHPGFGAAEWALEFVRTALLTPLEGAARRRKLYVSRADAMGRRIVNEDALAAMLAARGFETVVPTTLSVREQALLFASASHIVGIHGAGLTNLVFAPAGSRLLELFSPTYGMPTYFMLATGRHMKYGCYIAQPSSGAERSQLDDIIVDLNDFAARCADFL
jgi:capsular polysaccharide biosynthesis protein